MRRSPPPYNAGGSSHNLAGQVEGLRIVPDTVYLAVTRPGFGGLWGREGPRPRPTFSPGSLPSGLFAGSPLSHILVLGGLRLGIAITGFDCWRAVYRSTPIFKRVTAGVLVLAWLICALKMGVHNRLLRAPQRSGSAWPILSSSGMERTWIDEDFRRVFAPCRLPK